MLASQEVVDRLLDEESQNLAELEQFIGRPIKFQAEALYNQEQYDVVLIVESAWRKHRQNANRRARDRVGGAGARGALAVLLATTGSSSPPTVNRWRTAGRAGQHRMGSAA